MPVQTSVLLFMKMDFLYREEDALCTKAALCKIFLLKLKQVMFQEERKTLKYGVCALLQDTL